MAGYTYTDVDGNGDWNDAKNWEDTATGSSVNNPPGAGDDVSITPFFGAGVLMTEGATVASLSDSNGSLVLVGDLTVTGELEGGTFSGGTVSAGTFNGGIFQGATLSAGVISGGAELYAGTVQTDELTGARIGGATVSAADLGGDNTDVSMSAGTLDITTLSLDGGDLDVLGGQATVADAATFDGGGVEVEGGRVTFRDGLSGSDDDLYIGAFSTLSGPGGVVTTRDLSLGDQSEVTVLGSRAHLTVQSDFELGDSGHAYFAVLSGGVVTANVDLEIGGGAGGAAYVQIGPSGALEVAGDLQIAGGGSVSAFVSSGASVSVSGSTELAVSGGGSATLTLSDAGTVFTAAGGATVGGSGTATLTTQSGAVFDDGGDFTLGESHGANGSATLAGGKLSVGGDTTVGGSGLGTLAVTGGAATLSGNLTLGEAKGGSGKLTVGAGTLSLAGDMTIGGSGNGSVSIGAGGVVTPGSGSPPDGANNTVTLGENAGAKGALAVQGAGASLTSFALTVGAAGAGTLSIMKNAQVLTTGDASIAEDVVGTIQKAVVTSGGGWTVGGDLSVGEAGLATASVAAGGVLGVGGSLVLGEDAGASGDLGVTGKLTGSANTPSQVTWDTTLEVGAAGSGTLKVTGGAQVAVASGGVGAVEIGAEAGGVGLASVAGSGSELEGVSLAVGGTLEAAGGRGELSVGAGAVAGFTGSAAIWSGDQVVVAKGGTLSLGTTLDDGTLSVTGSASVTGGFAGTGTVAIGAGGAFALDASKTKTADGIHLATVKGTYSLTGGSGADLFQMSIADLTADDVISGGAGSDTLQFTTAGTIAASAFAHVSGIDVIRLAKGTDHLTLGNATALASDAKTLSITGGVGADTINLSAVSSARVVYDGSATTKSVVTAGSGPVQLTGGAGADLFEIAAANLTSADTIVGGTGNDTLEFTTAGILAVSAFAHVSGIDRIALAAGTDSLTLSNAVAIGSDAKTLTIVGSGTDTINLAAVTGATVVVDGAPATRSTVIAGAGPVRFTGGAGADLFKVQAAQFNAKDTLVGGAGSDTLQFTTAGTITAAELAHVAGIDQIALAAGTNSLTLSQAVVSKSDAASLSVTGSTGNDTLTGSGVTSGTLIFDGGGGTDTVHGGRGNNVYEFDELPGTLAITNSFAGGTAAHGTLAFQSALSDQDLWLERKGLALVIDVLGTSDQVTLNGWFSSNKSAEVAEITASGLELDTGVAKLVSAMAAFAKQDPGFNPTAPGTTMPADATLQNAIAAAWHK